MLALAPELTYVHEPFNLSDAEDLSTIQPDHWFEYVTPEAASQYEDAFERILAFQYPLWQRAKEFSVHFAFRRALYFWWQRQRGSIPLIKDPIALCSAEWLAEQFDLNVLVMVRHPAAFVGSLKKKEWAFPFGDLLEQPQLLEAYFQPYVEQIERFVIEEQPIVDQAALAWILMYTVVSKYHNRHSEWTFLRHEDVARNPLQTFKNLYRRLGLSYTDWIHEQIEAHSNPPGSAGENTIRRDSASVIQNWKRRLTEEEIRRVRERTEVVASNFYTDDDW